MRKREQIKLKEYWGLVWIIPALALVSIFMLYPIISAFAHSFTNWDGGMISDFIFMDNYREVLSDSLFWISMMNVVILTVVGMIIGNTASIFLAELMFNLKGGRLTSVYRFLFVLPAMIPGIVVLLLWQKLILSGSSTGVLNMILGGFGISPSEWFNSSNTAVGFLSIFLYGFPWMGGTSFLIYLAGFNNISQEVIEAAKLDGISTFGRVFKIDLPLIRGQIKYFLVFGFIQGLQNYTMQYAITSGAPGEIINDMQSGTMVPGFYIYQLIYGSSRMGAYGYACTIGVVMFVIILAITLINNKFFKTDEAL